MGEDKSDPQLFHGPFELGRFSGTLRDVNAAVASGGKLGGPVEVKRSRKTMLPKDTHADSEAAGQIFFFLKKAIEGFARGIIGTEDQGGFFFTKPKMRRTIEEQSCPLMGRSGSFLAMFGHFSDPVAEAAGTEPLPEGLSVDPDAILFFQHLRQMGEIEIPIAFFGQGNDPLPYFRGKCMGGHPPLISMSHSRWAHYPYLLLDPLHLSHGQSQSRSRILVDHLPLQ